MIKVSRGEEQPPYETTDPAITENFRQLYYNVDQLNFHSNKFMSLSSGTAPGESVRFEDNRYYQASSVFSETTGTTTTSSTFVWCPTTGTIIVSSNTSSVHIHAVALVSSSDATNCFVGIQRNGSNLFAHDSVPWIRGGTTTGPPVVIDYLDSPATQGQVGYSLVLANQATNNCSMGSKVATGSQTLIWFEEVR